MIQREKIFAEQIINRLSLNFEIKGEQWSKCGKNRIDYVITDNVYGLPFGIEFKQNESKRGEEIGEHILQAMRYACSEFQVNNKWQRIPILLCPPISFNYLQAPVKESLKVDISVGGMQNAEYFHDRHPRYALHHTANGLLGSLGIGEIRKSRYEYRNSEPKEYMRFMFSNQILWEETPDYNTGITLGMRVDNYNFKISKQIKYSFL